MSASSDEKLSGWRRTVAMSTVNSLIVVYYLISCMIVILGWGLGLSIVAVSAVKSAAEQLLDRCD